MTYRITTNGDKFRIEVKLLTLFCREKWYPMKSIVGLGCCQVLFDAEIDARNALERIMKRDAAAIQGWTPVGNPIEVEWTNG